MPRDQDEPLSVIELEESLEDAEEPENLPAGTYEAEIIDVQERTSDAGNEYYAVQFMISPDQYPPDFDADNAPDGVPLYYNRLMKPVGRMRRRAQARLKDFYQKMGLSTAVTTIDPSEWMGQKVAVRTRIGKYLGEERPEIVGVEAPKAQRTAPKRGKVVEAEAEEGEDTAPPRRRAAAARR